MKLRLQHSFPGVVHYVDGSRLIASQGRRVLESRDNGKTWKPLCEIPLSSLERMIAKSRLGRRLTRGEIHHIRLLENRWLVVLGFGRAYIWDLRVPGEPRALHPIVGSRPLSLCTDLRGNLYYGEYRGNPERGQVHIFRSSDLGHHWDVCYRFDRVRHVHGVFTDPFTQSIWVTTGDEDNESGIWRTEDDFGTLVPVVKGSQQSRAVQPLFSREHIYFGTDTPLEKNFIYRLPRAGGAPEPLQEVESSVFYGAEVANNLFFSTVCEPSAVNAEDSSFLWGSPDGRNWERLLSFPKDRWSMKLFQYGQVKFPAGRSETHLWITPYATRSDQRSFCYEVE